MRVQRGDRVQPRILVTGDYQHSEFSWMLNQDPRIRRIPVNQLEALDGVFDLVVIAESVPNQFPGELIEKIQAKFPLAPMVALVGSWCEGETRSGVPRAGLRRVYWHQWEGRLAAFIDQFHRCGITSWHAPGTATTGDLILPVEGNCVGSTPTGSVVAVSAIRASQFQVLNDSLARLDRDCLWLEQSWELPDLENFKGILIDTAAIDADLYDRIKKIRRLAPRSAMIVLASYPRIQEIQRLLDLGVCRVVSKPHTMDDLRAALSEIDRRK